MKKISIERLYEDFKLQKKLNNLSQESIIYYDLCYRKFLQYATMHKKKFVHDMTEKFIKHYIAYLIDSPISDYTKNTYIRGLKVFIKYAQSLKLLDLYKINLIKCNEVIKPTFTIDELRKLAARPADSAQAKAWIISLLLLSSAIRADTLCNLKVRDFNLSDGCFTLTKTKTRKVYVLPLVEPLQIIIKNYIIDNGIGANDYLFVNMRGRKLNRNTLWDTLHRYYISLGIEKTGVHIFRHTFGREYISNGGDAFTLQQMLTHSTMDQSKRYVRLYTQDLKIAAERYNPLAAVNIAKIQ